MSYPLDSVRQVCYTTIVDIVKKSLQVSLATSPKSKESFQTKFLMNPDVLYELVCFGLNDSVAKVRTCATDAIHHLLQSQLLMSDGLWQEFLLALSKSLPVLQSYTDHSSPLGRSLWYMLDPTTTTHNLALLDKMRGSLRLMLLSDKRLRIDSAKHLKWFLSNEQAADSKLPHARDLDPASMSACLILQTTQLVEDNCSRSVFKEEGVRQVYDIFSSDPVDPAVKKSAGDQLAIMMKDPHLHAVFKSRGGVEMVCSIIQKSVLKPGQDQKLQDDASPYLPACLSILHSLTHHDYSLRHTLARDHTLYTDLLRVSLLNQADEQLKIDTSHILTLLLFDEVAKFDVGFGQSQTPGTKFSLPAQVIQRYRLPFKPNCHHISSPSAVTLPDPSKDIMVTSGPREMMKIAWNCAWQGGLDALLESFETGLVSATNNEFSDVLALTRVERVVLETSSVSWSMCSNIRSIQEASSHASVIAALDRMLSYTTALKMASMVQFFSSHEWYLVLEKFMMVTPASVSDQSLLLHILRFISSAFQYLKPHPLSPGPALVWLVNKLHQPNGPLVNLLNTPTSGADSALPSIKRSLNKELLHYLTSLNLTLPYQLSLRLKPVQMRGDLVRALQRGLNITDAPHFYNLATLEGNLACLMHVTARPGWSRETSSLDAASLCNQLLNSLLEVVWSFHIGRGGTSRSYMGKGVTKSSTLCLRHLAYEMISNTEDQEWAKSWLYTRQEPNGGTDHGLNWLLTLWAYRDSEVRAAGLGIAVALTSTEAGRLLVTANCKHIPGGLWGAAFSILLDPEECCMVRQQAALLLVNLTAQPMPSGDVETTPGTWQGPLVIDPDYQLMLIGTNALVALLDHTNFYASLADLLNSLYTSSLVQPVLATTVISKMMESSLDISVSSDTTGGDKTGWTTGLTSVSSWSTNPTGNPTPNLTPRSRVTLSTDHSKLSSRDNTLSTSTNTDTSHGVDGGAYNPQGQPAPNQNLATPSLISSMVKLLVNVLNLTPHTCLDKIRAHSILTSLISTINPGTIHQLCDEMSRGRTGSASALTLIDLLRMYESVADLLTACVINDTNSRLEVLGNETGLKSLTSLVVLQWQEKDDVGNAFAGVSVSVLRLLSSLLQTHEAKVLSTLTVVLGPIWAPLVESICSMLDDHSANRLILHSSSLDFLALLCCEESRHLKKNPDRMMDVATISELFDATLGYDDTPENAKEEKTTGKLVSKVLVGLFDTLTKSGPDDKGARDMNRRLKVVSAFKSLLAVSQSAKEFALEAGLVELTTEHIKQTHAQLNLETLDMVTSGGKKEGPYLQELVNMFDFLRNFMYNNTSVKVACHRSGITLVIQKLWSWCQQEPTLLSSVLSFLITYSAHCNSAAGSLALPISAQTASRPGGQGTLLHCILKLTQRELDRDECSPVLRLTFALLTNLVMSADCRHILWKNNFLNQFSRLNPRRTKGKMRIAVDILWCELFSALSFSTDGQQIILKTSDVLTVLMDMMEAGPSRCQHCAMLIVRNLCCHAPNKPKILAADKLISVMMGQIENKTDKNRQLVASSALWALVHNSHKARIQFKAANIAPRLVDLLHDLQTSGSKSKVTTSCCENLKAIISQLRD
ncbi:unnamed protein product [Lymnaea stagnalis]|uniref:Rotatin n=1 Tax=Lymnaea stagnalis TaxID=6523 RepID=A0AAV2IQ58_LYMST